MSSRFYLSSPASTSNSSLSSTNADSLPFPKPLERSSFLAPDFDPAVFLSSLTNRFQTLEDLQSELVSLSQAIETELVDLVNDNYSEFLNLGSSLQGGEGRIDEVRAGLLGFERDVRGLRTKLEEEHAKIAGLVDAKREIMRQLNVGTGLLDVDRRLDELEVDLGLKERQPPKLEEQNDEVAATDTEPWGPEWDDEVISLNEDDEDLFEEGVVPVRLRNKVEKYMAVKVLTRRFDKDLPYLVAEQGRIRRIRETVLLDVDAAIRAKSTIEGKQALIRFRARIED